MALEASVVMELGPSIVMVGILNEDFVTDAVAWPERLKKFVAVRVKLSIANQIILGLLDL